MRRIAKQKEQPLSVELRWSAQARTHPHGGVGMWGGGAEIQNLLKGLLPWLTGEKTGHCISVLVKLARNLSFGVAKNLPSRVPWKTIHRKVSYWRCFVAELPKWVPGQTSDYEVPLSAAIPRIGALGGEARVCPGEAVSSPRGRKAHLQNLPRKVHGGWGAADLRVLLAAIHCRSSGFQTMKCCRSLVGKKATALHCRSLPRK